VSQQEFDEAVRGYLADSGVTVRSSNAPAPVPAPSPVSETAPPPAPTPAPSPGAQGAAPEPYFYQFDDGSTLEVDYEADGSVKRSVYEYNDANGRWRVHSNGSGQVTGSTLTFAGQGTEIWRVSYDGAGQVIDRSVSVRDGQGEWVFTYEGTQVQANRAYVRPAGNDSIDAIRYFVRDDQGAMVEVSSAQWIASGYEQFDEIVATRTPPNSLILSGDPTVDLGQASNFSQAGAATVVLAGEFIAPALQRFGATAVQVGEVLAAGARLAVTVAGRVIGHFIPGVGLVLTVYTAYAVTRQVFGEAGSMFTTSDGRVQQYVDAGGGTLRLMQQVPGNPSSPEEASDSWIVVGSITPLSDEERRRHLQPIITPIADPPQPQTGTPIGNEPTRTTTPPTAPLPPGPTTIVTPGTPVQTWVDTIVFNLNADGNRTQAIDRWQNDPTLRDPRTLEGQAGPGGAGVWGYPPTPRDPNSQTGQTGAQGQEQLVGNPYGIEINIGGTPTTTPNGAPTSQGGAWFDNVRVDPNGQIVAEDVKNWNVDTARINSSEWSQGNKDMLSEANRQRDATQGGNIQIEWRFTNADAAAIVRAYLIDARITWIRVVP
jgi:hypothetical protein